MKWIAIILAVAVYGLLLAIAQPATNQVPLVVPAAPSGACILGSVPQVVGAGTSPGAHWCCPTSGASKGVWSQCDQFSGLLPLAQLTDSGSASLCLLSGGGGGDPNWASCSSGSGDITDVGNCATGACFTSIAQNLVLVSPVASTGAMTARALTDADITDAITATTLAGGGGSCPGDKFTSSVSASAFPTCAYVPNLIGFDVSATIQTDDDVDTLQTRIACNSGLATANCSVTKASLGTGTGGTITATTAAALAANGANCSGNNFALGVNASGVGECAQPAFSNLSGAATDAQVPDTITLNGAFVNDSEAAIKIGTAAHTYTAGANTAQIRMRDPLTCGAADVARWCVNDSVSGCNLAGDTCIAIDTANGLVNIEGPAGTVLQLRGTTMPAVATGNSWTNTNSFAGTTNINGALTSISNTTSELWTEDFQAAYTTGVYHRIKQSTGNPSAGTLVQIDTTDADVKPFAVYGTGTTNGIEVSAAGALAAVGSGAITATNYVGSGSSTSAVDLATAEIAGVLPTANGGAKFGTATVDFTTMETESAIVIVSDTGVSAGSVILAKISYVATGDHTLDEVASEPLIVVAGNIVAGVSFDIVVTVLEGGTTNGVFTLNYTRN